MIEINSSELLENVTRGKGSFTQDYSPWRARFDLVYTVLLNRITTCQYFPGSRLDPEKLSKEFGVSRTPIRSVLQRLESEGLVISRHGVGTQVTEIDVEYIRDVMKFRMQLAALIGTFEPAHPDGDVLSHLADLRSDCDATSGIDDVGKYISLDMRLHAIKCCLIGNVPMQNIYRHLYFLTTRLWFSLFEYLDRNLEYKIVAEDIHQTESALKRGDIVAVGLLTRNFMSDGLSRIEDALRLREHSMTAQGWPD